MKILELQGLRGVAILSVLVFHFTVRWGSQTTGKPSLYPFGNAFGGAYWALFQGHLGVQLFFMISGFVIWSTLENSKSLAHFWAKRISRIWPPLLMALPLLWICFCFSPALPGSSSNFKDLALSFLLIKPQTLYLVSHGTVAYTYVTGVLWTLWIEVLFYLLASVIYFKGKFFLATLTGLGVAYAVYVLLSHTRLWLFVPDSAAWAFSVSPLADLGNYLWWFIAGATMYGLRKQTSSPKLWILYLAAFVATTLLSVDGNKDNLAAFAIANFMIFALFLPISQPKTNRFLSARWLVFVGNISFELYLVHEAIGVSVLQLIRVHSWDSSVWVLIPATTICLGLAYLIYKFWSVPACRWTKSALTSRLNQI